MDCDLGSCGICCPGPCMCVGDFIVKPGGGTPGETPGGSPEPERSASPEKGSPSPLSSDDCECWCAGGPIPRDFLRQITEDTRLSCTVNGMPLGEVGVAFACAFPGEVLVPAEEVYMPVTVTLKNVTVAELCERVGLVRRPGKRVTDAEPFEIESFDRADYITQDDIRQARGGYKLYVEGVGDVLVKELRAPNASNKKCVVAKQSLVKQARIALPVTEGPTWLQLHLIKLSKRAAELLGISFVCLGEGGGCYVLIQKA